MFIDTGWCDPTEIQAQDWLSITDRMMVIRSMAESLVVRALAMDGALAIDHLMPG